MPKPLDTIETTVDLPKKSQLVTLLTEEVEPVERNFLLNFLVIDQEKKEEEEIMLEMINIKNLLNNKFQLPLKKFQLNKLNLKNHKNLL